MLIVGGGQRGGVWFLHHSFLLFIACLLPHLSHSFCFPTKLLYVTLLSKDIPQHVSVASLLCRLHSYS